MSRLLSATMPTGHLRLTADDLTNSAPPAMHFGRLLGGGRRRSEVSYPVPRLTAPLRTTVGTRRLVRGAQRLAALKALHFNLAVGPIEGAAWIDIVLDECDGSPDSDDQPIDQLRTTMAPGTLAEAADRFCVPYERGLKAALGHIYAAANLQLASAGAILFTDATAIAIVCATSSPASSEYATPTSQSHTWSVFIPSDAAWHTFRSASATVRYLVERASREPGGPIPHYRYRVHWPTHSIARQRRFELDQPLPLYEPASSAPAIMQAFPTPASDDPPPVYSLESPSAPIAIRTRAAHPSVSLLSHSPTSPVFASSSSGSWSDVSPPTSTTSTSCSRVLASSAPRSASSNSSSPLAVSRRVITFNRQPIARTAPASSSLTRMTKAHDSSDSD